MADHERATSLVQTRIRGIGVQLGQGQGKLVQDPSFGDMFGISDQHMGMVVARKRNGTFLTIEGNWEDRVLSQVRPIAGHWFATPAFG